MARRYGAAVSVTGSGCAFCGAAGQLVDSRVLEDKWSRSFGGDPVVALDHGWYTSASGERVPADHRDNAKFFRPYLRALCDFCAHGWVEDVRWRAEPDLLAWARDGVTPAEHRRGDLVRWAELTAVLAELLEGMPSASTSAQRAALHAGTSPSPAIDTWFFTLAQALPSRVHLSQVAVSDTSLIQVVSIDVAHLSTLVVIPSDERARDVVDRAALDLGGPGLRLDLRKVAHPQRVAVERLCTTSTSGAESAHR